MTFEGNNHLPSVDGSLEHYAQRLEDLSPLGSVPKNLIIIATVVLGSTAKNLHEAVQKQEEGLNETASQRWRDINVPAGITKRVQMATGQPEDLDPRISKSATPLLKPSQAMETQNKLSKILMEVSVQLSATPNAATLEQTISKLQAFIDPITDETLRTSLEMQLLTPLTELLKNNEFDPRDNRTKLQNAQTLSAALDENELRFIEDLARSRSSLAVEAKQLLKLRPQKTI
jgi:hypothetical protein